MPPPAVSPCTSAARATAWSSPSRCASPECRSRRTGRRAAGARRLFPPRPRPTFFASATQHSSPLCCPDRLLNRRSIRSAPLRSTPAPPAALPIGGRPCRARRDGRPRAHVHERGDRVPGRVLRPAGPGAPGSPVVPRARQGERARRRDGPCGRGRGARGPPLLSSPPVGGAPALSFASTAAAPAIPRGIAAGRAAAVRVLSLRPPPPCVRSAAARPSRSCATWSPPRA